MQTIRLHTRTGDDGILHLDVPVGAPNADCEVTVTVPVATTNGQEAPDYPTRFFEDTAGAWQGDFVRDQGKYEQREEL